MSQSAGGPATGGSFGPVARYSFARARGQAIDSSLPTPHRPLHP